MLKPYGYDEALTITGELSALPPGGYICRILDATVTQSKNKHEMLVLNIDITEGEYSGYFKRIYDSSQNGNDYGASQSQSSVVSWPCVYRQLTDGNSIGFFKGLISSIESSNPGYKWNWEERTLKGKLVGAIFGREEFYSQYKGEYRWSTKMQYARSVDVIRKREFKVPEDKPIDKNGYKAGLSTQNRTAYRPSSSYDQDMPPFESYYEIDESDLPF